MRVLWHPLAETELNAAAHQRGYSGLRTNTSMNAVTWGIFHLDPDWLEPGAVDAELDDDDNKMPLLTV